ncbi:6-phospho-3-hexuloisomerase [Arboricoccus pini]|uniref:6-phospho-3-hexuloisomerase n=1 Tax=Arboricoccus pini TaxID=1963835 RepID=A0A212R7S4_9PROT|nr:SIS domain-containing protein [Arboricoccus pini]SNB68212.1 6-phospho-3-hexuloisomerase [Arboricoccus pini]
MKSLWTQTLAELDHVFAELKQDRVQLVVNEIANARTIVLYGVGREGLQIKGFAMRLYHLGLKVGVVGEMIAPAIGPGDLLIVSAGPGQFATVGALMTIAGAAGARVLVITADPQGNAAAQADLALVLPAQTMASDRDGATSVLPMGSLYEGALFLLLEIIVPKLRHRLGVNPATMRANHTNLE